MEDLAFLVRVKDLEAPGSFKEPLKELSAHVVKTAHLGCDLIYELDTLLESSFGGMEADRVEKAANAVATEEWEADKKQVIVDQKRF